MFVYVKVWTRAIFPLGLIKKQPRQKHGRLLLTVRWSCEDVEVALRLIVISASAHQNSIMVNLNETFTSFHVRMLNSCYKCSPDAKEVRFLLVEEDQFHCLLWNSHDFHCGLSSEQWVLYNLHVFAFASYTERSFGYLSTEVCPKARLKPPPM